MDRILRATAAVGLSSLLSVGLGALRYKFIALELGASGVGLLGILMSAAAFGVGIFSLGLSTSGVQATAAASGDSEKLQSTKMALIYSSIWLGGIGGVLVAGVAWFWGGSLLPKPQQPALLVWLGIALAAMVISGVFLAFLNGTGRIRAIALSNTFGAVVGTIVTVAAVYISGQAGLIAALAAAPLATLACSGWFLAREPKAAFRPRFSDWFPELRGMVLLGGAVMLALLLTTGTQLLVRVWLEQSKGLNDAGYFQAAWTISSLYLGFVLSGLAVEYYPRISSQIGDTGRLNASVDNQIRVALLLGSPILLWMMTLSPLILRILYAPAFQSATAMLQWQLLGDVLKIVGWSIGFLLLARKARGFFFIAELSWNLCYLALAVVLASRIGLVGLGIAYTGGYAVYVLVTLWFARRETGYGLSRGTFTLVVGLLVVGSVTLWGVQQASVVGFYTAVVLASACTIVSVLVLRRWHVLERKPTRDIEVDESV
jgi:enterobacterial common antigen flippase